jgi:hypothetical protein
MEAYSDTGGVCWYAYETIPAGNYGDPRDTSKDWATPGGDYSVPLTQTVSMEDGTSNLELDITSIVSQWIAGSLDNHGLIIKFNSTTETTAKSYYTTRFFGRESEFFYSRPTLEVRYDDSTSSVNEGDGRENFFKYSPRTAVNTNRIYFYNYINGSLEDVPAHGDGGSSLGVAICRDDSSDTVPVIPLLTATWARTGVYYCDVEFNPTVLSDFSAGDSLVDKWYLSTDPANSIYEGDIVLKEHSVGTVSFDNKRYRTSLRNQKRVYYPNENPTFRLHIQESDWKPNFYTGYHEDDDSNTVILECYYRISRTIDNLEIIPFSNEETIPYSKMSFDSDGNHFSLDMASLQPGYMYSIQFGYVVGGEFVVQPETFNFRVEEFEGN